jgi:hypothetical protein
MPADHEVIPRPAVEPIRLTLTDDDVVARTASELIERASSDKQVVAVSAIHHDGLALGTV